MTAATQPEMVAAPGACGVPLAVVKRVSASGAFVLIDELGKNLEETEQPSEET